MVEIIRNYELRIAKKGSVAIYFIGLALAVTFGAILVMQPKVLAQTNQPPKVKNVELSPEAGAEVPRQNVATPPPVRTNLVAPKKTAPAMSPRPVASLSPINQPLVPATPVVVPDTTKIKINGVGEFEVALKDGDSALDILKRAAAENGFNLQTTAYSFGVMVDVIGGQKAEGTNFWAFYYNGAQAMVGAADQKVFKDDITEWRFESWQ